MTLQIMTSTLGGCPQTVWGAEGGIFLSNARDIPGSVPGSQVLQMTDALEVTVFSL